MIRNVAVVMRGTIVAQGIGVLILPVLTRLFDPAAFGQLQLYLSVLTLLIVAPSLRYDIAILRASDAELPMLLRLCLLANIGVAALLLAVGYSGAMLAPASWLASAPFPIWMPILGMSVSGIAQVLLYVAIRDERFQVNANSKVAQSISYAGAGTGLGIYQFGANGLILADLAGRLINLGWLYRWFRSRPPIVSNEQTSLRSVAVRYKEYPLIALPGGIVNSAGGVMTPIMIYATFTAEVAGQYGLVDRVMALPVGLVAVAVSQAFMGQLSTALRSESTDPQKQFRNLVKWLALVGVLPAICVMLFAKPVFILVFGVDWAMAGTFAQIIAPASFTGLLTGCVGMTLSVIGRQKAQMSWEIGRLAAMIGLWTIISIWRLSAMTSIILHSCLLIGVNIIFLLLCDFALRDQKLLAASHEFSKGKQQ